MPEIDYRAALQCLVCGEMSARVISRGCGPSGTQIEIECPKCKASGKISNMTPWYGRELKESEAKSIFELAGIKVLRIIPILNQYHSGGSGEKQYWHPWWLVKTDYGLVEIGWRKRVISISWEDTKVRGIVTKDELTKDEAYVHAYSIAKAVEYLTEWNRIALLSTIPV
ncbi:hypothetical protein CCP1ISM_470007 [Azospirillaceae bacterium]